MAAQAAQVADKTADLAWDLATFASNAQTAALPEAVVTAAKVNILDTLACAIAGSTALAIDEVADMVQGWGGAEQADMWVFGGKYPAHHAALINGGMSHARDYDDTHDDAVLHAGVTAVPAAIAAGQLRGGLSGADLIAAVAVGLETTCRLGLATQPSIVESGFIYTPLLGVFGATAAAGRALGLNEDQMLNAFGIAYSSVAGNHQVTRDASHMKRLQPGLMAQAAVVAAQMAARGIRGAQATFEGVDGFFRVYFDSRVDAALVRRGLGRDWEMLGLSYKPYPCCRVNHTSVDAALQIRAQAPQPSSEIEEIRVGVTAQGYQIVCTPEEIRRHPKTVVQAQFSIPYTVASAWVDGRLGLTNFTDEAVARPEVLELAARVKPYADEAMTLARPRGVTPSQVEVVFKDGQTLKAEVSDAKGHPKNPMTEADFLAKAEDCVALSARPLKPDTARRLSETVARLERVGDISELVAILT